MSILMEKIMEQVNAVARAYVQVQYDFENDNNATAHIAELDKLRAMIEDALKVPDGWQLAPGACKPEYEVKPMKVSSPIDCCQCEQFVCERMACAATHSCVNGSQYEPSGFVQIFTKE